MSAHRKIDIKDLPAWPRRMAAPIAAAYCGVSEGTLDQMVKRAEIPAPVRIGKRKLWDKRAIDNVFDRQAGLDSTGGSWVIDK